MMDIEVWTRIAIEGEDFFDVIESYEAVKKIFEFSTTGYLEFTNVNGVKITIRKTTIQSFYESGVEILRNNWVRLKDMEDLKKTVLGWEES